MGKMKNLVSCIDDVKIKDIDGFEKVRITGWAFCCDGSPLKFQVFMNGKLVQADYVQLTRSDVFGRFQHYLKNSEVGFSLSFNPQTPVHSLAVNINGETILDMGMKKVERKKTHNFIEYEFDSHASLTPDGSSWVRGFAYSIDGEPVEIFVVDSNGIKRDIELQRVNQESLIQLGEVGKGEKAGFYVTFPGGYGEKNTLVLKTSREEKHLPIVAQKNSGKDIAKIVWHSANPIRIYNAVHYLQKNGIEGFKKKAHLEAKRFSTQLKRGQSFNDFQYNAWFLDQAPTAEELEKQRTTQFLYNPKISIIVAAFNTPIEYLTEMIDSVRNQTYTNWELCISDGSTDEKVEEHIRKNYSDDERIKYIRLTKNYGIAGNMNKAMDLASGDYISLFDHDDLLTPDCLFEVVSSLQDFHYDVIYTDEDKLNDMTKGFMDPHFKPDFAVDQLRSHNYITHFLTVSRKIVNEIGQLNPEYDGSQDHDFILRATEKANAVHHIPKILYHWRMHPSSTAMNPESKMYCYVAGQKAVKAQLDRLHIKGEVEMLKPLFGMYHVKYDTSTNPLVSVIIPNKDHAYDLQNCIDSIMELNTYKNIEIIVVENNSEDRSIFDCYEKLQNKYPNVRVVTWEKEFNYPKINNYGREFAKGELLLFLNNDTELINPDSIREMVGLALQPEIGAVGAKLLYKDHTIQHAGVVLGYKGYATHAFLGIPDNDPGHMQRPQIVSDYSAVTAACMMVKATDFDAVEGFDPQFRVAVNDVDLCLKLGKLNKRIVYTPFSKWFHYESKSRGLDYDGKNNERFLKEVELFQKKWPDAWQKPDPFHNVNFKLDKGPFSFYE